MRTGKGHVAVRPGPGDVAGTGLGSSVTRCDGARTCAREFCALSAAALEQPNALMRLLVLHRDAPGEAAAPGAEVLPAHEWLLAGSVELVKILTGHAASDSALKSACLLNGPYSSRLRRIVDKYSAPRACALCSTIHDLRAGELA
jgi:hypothetical protein